MICTWTNDLYGYNGGPEGDIIQEGLDKLSVYRERTELVPAYVISMSQLSHGMEKMNANLVDYTVLNPLMKLHYYSEHEPDKVSWAKSLFCRTVSRFPCIAQYNYSIYCLAITISWTGTT